MNNDLDAQIARFKAEQEPRALFIEGVKVVGGFFVIAAALLYIMDFFFTSGAL